MIPVVAALINAGLGILGNAVATKGKDFIEDKLNVNIDKLLGSEEGKIQLAQLENQHEETLQKYAIERRGQELEEIKLEHSNTADARALQAAALAQEDKFSKRFVYYLASGWSISSVLYIGLITFMDIPLANIRFVDTILGFILGTVIASVLNYFFGSTKSSQFKDVTIAEAVKGMKQ
jgi:hypothetical protein